MKKIRATIEINAAPEKVWSILLDQSSFQKWNPFIKVFEGNLKPGSELNVTIHPPGGRKTSFRPKVLNSTFPELKWRGKLLVKGIFDGEHYFRCEPTQNGGTRFTQGENFSGLLVELMESVGGMFLKTERGFHEMNKALKIRAEK